MKNILVPTDFSACANNALNYALEIALQTNATLHLLHVVYPTEGVDNNVYNSLWFDDYLDARRKSLDELVARLLSNERLKGISVKTQVEIGYPASTSVTYADDIHADLIVMGTNGSTGIAAFLGSTSATLISKTRRPILTVPPGVSFRGDSKLALATDFKLNLSSSSLSTLKAIVELHQSKLQILHILSTAGEKVDKSKEQIVSEKLHEIPHDFHYLHDADVPQAVSDYLEATETNILVTISHEHGFWHKLLYESVSKTLAQHTKTPALVLHDRA